MELTQSDVRQITEWFMSGYPYKLICPICEGKSFEFPGLLYTPILLTPMIGSNIVTPTLQLHCYGCSHIMSFSAIKLEGMGCPIFQFRPKKNVFSFLDYFKRKKK